MRFGIVSVPESEHRPYGLQIPTIRRYIMFSRGSSWTRQRAEALNGKAADNNKYG